MKRHPLDFFGLACDMTADQLIEIKKGQPIAIDENGEVITWDYFEPSKSFKTYSAEDMMNVPMDQWPNQGLLANYDGKRNQA